MRTRSEHMEWAKTRALEYVGMGDGTRAIASLLSDLGKHPETEGHSAIVLTGMLMVAGHLDTDEKVRKHIDGFN